MKPFSCIVSDPGWKFRDNLPGKGRGARKHYRCDPTVSIAKLHQELLGFKVPRKGIISGSFSVAPTSWLFLWRVAAMQEEAIEVANACGYTVKSEIVWVKDKIGMGHYVRGKHETCLICTRGPGVSQLRLDRSIPSVIVAPRGRHSEKPAEFYRIVEKLCKGPRLELFARTQRRGWTVWGDEIDQASAAPAAVGGEI